MKKKLFLYVTQHIDLVWRRCFDRDFTYKNQNFVSYADLFELYITENIKFCDKYDFYKFSVESVAVLEKFLERRPEYKEKIKELFDKKQLYVPFSGHNIVDVNLIGGESIVRNYLYGYEYLKNNFNHIPYGIERLDAFGNSAQMPQIAKSFGSDWIYHVGYSVCDSDYWRGLDGSTVVQFDPDTIQFVGGWYKYRPCPDCNGFKDKDCPTCSNRRIDEEYLETFRSHIYDPQVTEDDIPKRIQCGGEEVIPSEEPIIWSLENKDKYDIIFTSTQDYKPYIQTLIDGIDTADEKDIHPSCELNANNTGCYVTRIKIKQSERKIENLVLGAETLACANFVKTGNYPTDEMKKIWDKILFTAFHDSVTGTIIDAGYDEIMDSFAEAKERINLVKDATGFVTDSDNNKTVTVYNPYGIEISADVTASVDTADDISFVDADGNFVSVSGYEKNDKAVAVTFLAENIPPFGSKTYNVVKKDYKKDVKELYKADKSQVRAVLNNELFEDSEKDANIHFIENEYFKVSANEKGIVEIFDKNLGKVISKESEYMVGEWILEHDEGSPWATLSEDMRRQKLSTYTTLEKIEKSEDIQRFVFNIVPQDVEAYAVLGFKMKYTVTLQKNCDMVKFDADVYWHTQNYRLRIAVPAVGEARHFYDIPYGVIERKPYKPNIIYPNGSTNIASAAGDYPAINWAGVETKGYSMALFNKGTPSYQIDNDKNNNATIYLTPVRSPSVGVCLYSPAEYTMTDYDGMRDAGEHHFEYAIKAYDCGFDSNKAVPDGVAFNAELIFVNENADIPKLPLLLSENARISSVKASSDGKGIVYRICEYNGKNSEAVIEIPKTFNVKNVYQTDMKEERRESLAMNEGKVDLKLRAFEIKTIYMEL